LAAALLLLFHVFHTNPEGFAMGRVREPAVAGIFYPREKGPLEEQVRGFISGATDLAREEEVVALCAPHAGYRYSGHVAGWAYRQVEGRTYDAVVVISPSHRVPFRGVSIWPKGAYRTPLGLVEVHEPLCRQIMETNRLIRDIPEAHGPEHALEVQLPFLQVALNPGWRLIPLIIGSQDKETARSLADTLFSLLQGGKALVVASSDLSHYHEATVAETMDHEALEFMVSMDIDGLWKAIRKGKVEACGIGAVLTAILYANRMGVSRGRLLKYAHSGDITGDRAQVVGYGAVLWTKERQSTTRRSSKVGVDLGLTDEEKKTLKEIAYATIESRLEGRNPPDFSPRITPTLREPRGAFVTLQKDHQLRGCIGMMEALKPLYETVMEMAEAAAFRDPRFPPLKKEELPQINIEISVLTPMRQIKGPSEIEIGRDGLYIIKGPFHGVLLPQVATECGWDVNTFLEQTCLKAGLPPNAWRSPETKIYAFSAEIF
jgi:hypothetical protein